MKIVGRLIFVSIIFWEINISMAQDLKSTARFYTIRLKPHQDLKAELVAFAKVNRMKAAFVATCVGSLEQLNLRYANQQNSSQQSGHFEIVSLVGTFNENAAHLHLSVSDSTGQTFGGHLLEGNKVYTTAEIVIGELADVEFSRELDSTYGYQELRVKKRKE